MSDSFKYLLRVRYSECDQQKVVFNAKYAEYVDIATTEYHRLIWGGFDKILARGVDFQVVNLNISWKSSAYFDDVIVITAQTVKIGNSSYTVGFELTNYQTGQLIATSEAVYVAVNANSLTKMSIPEDLKVLLDNGADDQVINHSGVDLS